MMILHKPLFLALIGTLGWIPTLFAQSVNCGVRPDENGIIELSIENDCALQIQWQYKQGDAWLDIAGADSSLFQLYLDTFQYQLDTTHPQWDRGTFRVLFTFPSMPPVATTSHELNLSVYVDPNINQNQGNYCQIHTRITDFIELSPVTGSYTNVIIEYNGPELENTTYNWDFSGGTVISGSDAGPYELSYSTGSEIRVRLTLEGYGCELPVFESEPFKVELVENIEAGLPSIYHGDVEWVDYNNDGLLDVMTIGSSWYNKFAALPTTDTTQLYRNVGASVFEPIETPFPDLRNARCAWGDYDNDNWVDVLLIGSTPGDTLPVTLLYRNLEGNGFELYDAGLPNLREGLAEWADINNDGDIDLLIAGVNAEEEIKTHLFLNEDGVFFETDSGLEHVRNGAAAFGDYNNDSYLDLILLGKGPEGRRTLIYRNDFGTFTALEYPLTGLDYGDAAWADLDNDGDLDFGISGKKAEYISGVTDNGQNFYDRTEAVYSAIFENHGNDYFSRYPGAGIKSLGDSGIDWGDFDNDGDEDLAITGTGEVVGILIPVGGGNTSLNRIPRQSMALIYRNDGNDGFTPIDPPIPGINSSVFESSQISFGDYDNDNDLDILREGHIEGWFTSDIYRNHPYTANQPPSAPQGLRSNSPCNTAYLSWEAVSDDHTPSQSITYGIYVGSSPGSGDIFSRQNHRSIQDTFLRIPEMEPGTYYWSVEAIDGSKVRSGYAEEQSFTVTEEPPQPIGSECDDSDEYTINDVINDDCQCAGSYPCTSLLRPVNGSANVSDDGLLEWAPVQNATGYRLTIGTLPYDDDILNEFDVGDTTTFLAGPLPLEADIYVTITPYFPSGAASGCVTESFMVQDCRHRDSMALVALYEATDGPNWVNTWDLNEPISEWFGVSGESGIQPCQVAFIGLAGNNLTGQIPKEIGDIEKLKRIDLSGNNLNGAIPASIGKLYRLDQLNLSQNQLSGPLPEELGSLGAIRFVGLSNNQIDGPIPSEIGQLVHLQRLDLSHNQLTGNIPEEIGALQNLDELKLNNNNLIGAIPKELGDLGELRLLYLGNNQLSGSLPLELSQLSNLYWLSLYNNRISGPIPDGILSLGLGGIYLANNDLSPCLPDDAVALCQMTFRENEGDFWATGYNITGNPKLPWEGDLTAFCNGASQDGAPCNDGKGYTYEDQVREGCSCLGTFVCSTLNSSTNGANDVPREAELSWDSIPGALGYLLSVGTSSGGSDILSQYDVGDALSFSPGLWPPGDSIFVRVEPYFPEGQASECGETFFITERCPDVLPQLSVDTTICFGESFMLNDITYENNGTYADTILIDACPVEQQVALEILEEKRNHIDTVLCWGQSLEINGQVYNGPVTGAIEVIPNVGPFGCDSIIIADIVVVEPPTLFDSISFTINTSDTLQLSPHGSYNSYLWHDGSDGATITIFPGDYAPGDYELSLTVIDEDGCTWQESLMLTVEQVVNVKESSERLNPHFYPNPTTGLLKVRFSGSFSLDIALYTPQGNLVQKATLSEPVSALGLDHLPSGIYYLRWKREVQSGLVPIVLIGTRL